MNPEEYEHLYQIYLHVFSAPPDSPERQKRLAEINEEDSSKLWDFHCGLLSGRIKQPEIIRKESEGKCMTYREYRTAVRRNSCQDRRKMLNFESQNPMMAQAYKKRLEEEKKKRSEILAIQDTMMRHEAIRANMALFER